MVQAERLPEADPSFTSFMHSKHGASRSEPFFDVFHALTFPASGVLLLVSGKDLISEPLQTLPSNHCQLRQILPNTGYGVVLLTWNWATCKLQRKAEAPIAGVLVLSLRLSICDVVDWFANVCAESSAAGL